MAPRDRVFKEEESTTHMADARQGDASYDKLIVSLNPRGEQAVHHALSGNTESSEDVAIRRRAVAAGMVSGREGAARRRAKAANAARKMRKSKDCSVNAGAQESPPLVKCGTRAFVDV